MAGSCGTANTQNLTFGIKRTGVPGTTAVLGCIEKNYSNVWAGRRSAAAAATAHQPLPHQMMVDKAPRIAQGNDKQDADSSHCWWANHSLLSGTNQLQPRTDPETNVGDTWQPGESILSVRAPRRAQWDITHRTDSRSAGCVQSFLNRCVMEVPSARVLLPTYHVTAAAADRSRYLTRSSSKHPNNTGKQPEAKGHDSTPTLYLAS